MKKNSSNEAINALMATALKAMNIHDIPVSPENYTVWYTHAAQKRADLSEHLTHLIADKSVFDTKLNADIYSRFFGETFQQRIDHLNLELRRMADLASQNIGEMGAEMNQYESSLTTYTKQLQQIDTPKDLTGLIGKLINDTRTTTAAANQAGSSLTDLSREIVELRGKIEKLSEEAYTDQLTTLANRRSFDEDFKKLYKQAKLLGYGFSLVIMDIDFFKKFNDTHGHAVGDLVLRFVGKTLKNNTKGQDKVARYGGEEFAILLPDTICRDALMLTEKLRMAIGGKPLTSEKVAGKRIEQITVSAGVAQYREGDSQESLFKRADDCLYQAKKRGRNCVVGEESMA